LADHPDTKILSVSGTEHIENNPYDNYFKSDEVFRGGKVKDERLGPKEAIYSFQLDGKVYAVPFGAFENGGTFDLGDKTIFLYRPSGVEIFYSTLAFVDAESSFEMEGDVWRHTTSGATFDPDAGTFGKVERLDGFDTFWFNWSMTHPETEVLAR
jgi:hypothetical protein